MRFCYCPACRRLRPFNWYARRKCENCLEECVIFEVQRSIYGRVMYGLCAVAGVLLVLYFSWYQMGWEWASSYSAVPSDISMALVFGMLFLAFAMAYLDLTVTTKKAEERVRKGIAKGE